MIRIIILSIFLVTVSFADELMEQIYPEMSGILCLFNSPSAKGEQAGIVNLNDSNTNGQVWSFEYEEYVDPADFKMTSMSTGDEMIFNRDKTAGEYQIQ